MLTTGVDDFPGTAGRDVFKGAIGGLTPTFGVTDKIDGAAGNDRLELTLNGDWAGLTTGSVKNVETLKITNANSSASTFDAKGISGSKNLIVTSKDADITFSNIGTGLTSVSFNAGGEAQDFTYTYEVTAPEVNATTTSLGLTLEATGKAGTTPTRSEILLTDVQTVNLTAVGANFTTLAGTDLRDLTVSGSGNFDTDFAANSAIRSVDGSSSTGILKLNLSNADAGAVTSIKTGAGADSIIVNAQSLVANATIAGGDGSDTLTLGNGVAGRTVQYSMTGIENLVLGASANTLADGTLVFAGTNVNGLSKITSSEFTDSAVTFADMKTASLEFVATGTTADIDITSDHSGATTLTYGRDSTQTTDGAQAAPGGDYVFSDTSSLSVTVGPSVNQIASDVTANKATSVTLDVSSGKSAGGEEQTVFSTADARIYADAATSLTINATGNLGTGVTGTATANSAQFVIPKAKSVSITNGDNAGFVALATKGTTGTSALETLTLESNANLTVHAVARPGTVTDAFSTAEPFAGLKTLNVTAGKGTTLISDNTGLESAPSALAALNVANLSGSGSNSKVVLGAVGATTNNYDLTVNATGLKGGLTTGVVSITTGKNVSFDLTGTTGDVLIGTIGASASAGNVTVKAANVGKDGTSNVNGIEIGNISATGTVSIDASGVRAPLVGTISGKDVTVNFANTTAISDSDKPIVGTITTTGTANLNLFNLNTNTQIINGTGSSLAVTVNGGVGEDTITVNGTGSSTMTSLTVSGDLGAGTDSLIVNGGSKAKTINISGLTNYDGARITGGAGADTITGGAGKDTIFGGAGADVLTGGGGADSFVFQFGDSKLGAITKITDFGPTDAIVHGDAALTFFNGSTTSTTANVDADDITALPSAAATLTFASGGVQFSGTASGYADLAQKVALIDRAIGTGEERKAVFFTHANTLHLFVQNSAIDDHASDLVIELTGISSLPTLTTANITDTGNTTGIFGIGA